jgi:glyoxylase-like metal-dependent hydrolase (beta-lactamase superfamily II)
MTDELDCHIYMVTDGTEAILIDSGGGRDTERILQEIERDGIDPSSIRQLWLTHAHADHGGGAASLRTALGVDVLASSFAADCLERGDEVAISLDRARQAGGYPADYRFSACPVRRTLNGGDRLPVGKLEIEVIDSPGHCGGHLSFHLLRPGGTDLFTGDALFWGGKILLQDIWDCSAVDSCRSVERLAASRPDGLYPAHGAIARNRGWVHADTAMELVSQLLPPQQFVP